MVSLAKKYCFEWEARENGTCYPVCVAGAGVCGGGKREWYLLSVCVTGAGVFGGGKREWNLLSCVCGRGWCM